MFEEAKARSNAALFCYKHNVACDAAAQETRAAATCRRAADERYAAADESVTFAAATPALALLLPAFPCRLHSEMAATAMAQLSQNMDDCLALRLIRNALTIHDVEISNEHEPDRTKTRHAAAIVIIVDPCWSSRFHVETKTSAAYGAATSTAPSIHATTEYSPKCTTSANHQPPPCPYVSVYVDMSMRDLNSNCSAIHPAPCKRHADAPRRSELL